MGGAASAHIAWGGVGVPLVGSDVTVDTQKWTLSFKRERIELM